MNGADPDRWSAVAAEWDRLWGDVALPVWRAVVDATGIGSGRRVLDIGCDSGNLLAHLDSLGASTAGLDPAPGMVDLARSRVATDEVRHGSFERPSWPDSKFDVVPAFNALHSRLDPAARTRRDGPGGGTGWLTGHRQLGRGRAQGLGHRRGRRRPGRRHRTPAGRAATTTRWPGGPPGPSSLAVTATGLVEVPWDAPDDDVLVRAVLLGECTTPAAAAAPAVLASASPFRTAHGGYHLVNAFRFAVGRLPHHP